MLRNGAVERYCQVVPQPVLRHDFASQAIPIDAGKAFQKMEYARAGRNRQFFRTFFGCGPDRPKILNLNKILHPHFAARPDSSYIIMVIVGFVNTKRQKLQVREKMADFLQICAA
ncbi:MAG: hypothetical protein FWE89_05460 [Syntrophaceae bacterium]|nr:hypothetical protein [Syntrophaceae bacterium]